MVNPSQTVGSHDDQIHCLRFGKTENQVCRYAIPHVALGLDPLPGMFFRKLLKLPLGAGAKVPADLVVGVRKRISYEREGSANLSRAARTEWPCNAKPATAHSHKPSLKILRNQWDKGCVQFAAWFIDSPSISATSKRCAGSPRGSPESYQGD